MKDRRSKFIAHSGASTGIEDEDCRIKQLSILFLEVVILQIINCLMKRKIAALLDNTEQFRIRIEVSDESSTPPASNEPTDDNEHSESSCTDETSS